MTLVLPYHQNLPPLSTGGSLSPRQRDESPGMSPCHWSGGAATTATTVPSPALLAPSGMGVVADGQTTRSSPARDPSYRHATGAANNTSSRTQTSSSDRSNLAIPAVSALHGSSTGRKRKLDLLYGGSAGEMLGGSRLEQDPHMVQRQAKRISPFHNTPKQRRDEKRRLLKLSLHKLHLIPDPERYLRRSVLINNTARRIQEELNKEKKGCECYNGADSTLRDYVHFRRRLALADCEWETLNNSYLTPGANLYDEAWSSPCDADDKLIDDTSDALINSVCAIGDRNLINGQLGRRVLEDGNNNNNSSISSNCSSQTDLLKSHRTSDSSSMTEAMDCDQQPQSLSLTSSSSSSVITTATISSSSISSPSFSIHDEGSHFNLSGASPSLSTTPASASLQTQSQQQDNDLAIFGEVEIAFNNLITAIGDTIGS
eukprot:GHVU01104464.1.p1 GENE.GHVU01104464.1~~GHVU01104464.1.p1  ORF type:complete len:430 (-),score=26.68 GHVU01104464.1:1588-2877(-)